MQFSLQSNCGEDVKIATKIGNKYGADINLPSAIDNNVPVLTTIELWRRLTIKTSSSCSSHVTTT
jgi:hypothetical protein